MLLDPFGPKKDFFKISVPKLDAKISKNLVFDENMSIYILFDSIFHADYEFAISFGKKRNKKTKFAKHEPVWVHTSKNENLDFLVNYIPKVILSIITSYVKWEMFSHDKVMQSLLLL